MAFKMNIERCIQLGHGINEVECFRIPIRYTNFKYRLKFSKNSIWNSCFSSPEPFKIGYPGDSELRYCRIKWFLKISYNFKF